MRVEKDYEELLKLFNQFDVRYCVIGAFAMAFHVEPRYTKDMDILIEPTSENSGKIISALDKFGFGSLKLSEKDFCQKGQFIQLGFEPVRIDLITSIEGLDFQTIWEHRVKGKYGRQSIFFIGLNELIKSKEIAGRKQDLADLEKISFLNKQKKRK